MYSIQQIASITNATFLNKTIQEGEINNVLFDSRQLVQAKGALFFAILTEKNDGHRYIDELIKKGVQHFIVTEKDIFKDKNCNYLLVEDAIIALQQLALFHRQQFDLPCIGITGSNGKTVVKEWLFQLLQDDFNIVRSPKSYNSQIGVPMSVWQINKRHNLGIFEAGISQAGEMQSATPIIQAKTGIFTNIGEAHQEGFPSLEAKILEKIQLFSPCETIVYCLDHIKIQSALQERFPLKKHLTWSKSQTASLQITSIDKLGKGIYGTQIKGVFNQEKRNIKIPFTDAASIENAIHCWLLLLDKGYSEEILQARFWELKPVAMRLQLVPGINNCLLVNDSYNSDLTSLRVALNFLENHSNKPKKTLILSDILQSGMEQEALYGLVAQLIHEKGVQRFIGIGKFVEQLKTKLSVNASFYKNPIDFLKAIPNLNFQNENILLKGARKFHFEQIAQRLEEKAHQTVLEVNLTALEHNLQVFKKHIQKGVNLMVMVKAAAYGSGSFEVARLLEQKGIDYLAVAYIDEGVELRKKGIQLPILVLNPEPAGFDALLRYNLEAEIYSLKLLRQFVQASQDISTKIHLKLDTGMRRLGFEFSDLEELCLILNQNKNLRVQSIFSHLVGSEANEHDHFTQQQIKIYNAHYQIITQAIGYRPTRHILNSAGILRFPEHQMDMVRLGIGLYGFDGAETIQNQLQDVSTLKASISQIKQLAPQETIGYSRKGKAKRLTKTATISIGYADGLSRLTGNGNYTVLIHGKKAPTIGNICMDMCMVDVTQIPEAQEGDEVIIFGKGKSIIELAQQMQTIPYEVLTMISDRVKRVYYQEQ